MLQQLMRRLAWLLFAGTTVWLCSMQLRQQVDPGNRALKVPGSPEAHDLRELAEVVPDDPVVLVACLTRGTLELQPSELEQLAELRARLLELPGVRSCEAAPIDDPGLWLLPVGVQAERRFEVGARVVETARRLVPPTLRVLATGLPLIEGTIADLVAGERQTIVPALLGVLFAAAWAFYRRLRLAIAVLLPALVAIAWTGGTVAWLGHRLDPVAALLDPVLLTIGVAASVHFVEAFRRARLAGHSAAVAARHARLRLRRPACWATVTTLLGLWSLTSNDTPAVIDFGLRAALGVALAHLFTFVLLPPWLGATTPPARTAAAPEHGAWWLRTLLRHRAAVLSLTATAIALAATGVLRLEMDNDPLRMLPESNPVRADYEALAARLGAVELCHVLVPAGSAGADPGRLLPFAAALRELPGVAGFGGAVQRGGDGRLALPLLLRPGGSRDRERLFADIDRAGLVLGLDGARVVGEPVQIARDSARLMRGLVRSLGLSLLLLTAAMAIGLRSLRLALCALLPNLLPSLWLYGALGLAGRPVSVATAMIGCTMLGLIVDNTLHLLHHYRDGRRHLHRGDALRRALDRCGRAMSLSSAVLLLGFATAGLSQLSTTVEFAMLACATIVLAWFATAVLLPTVLASLPQRREAAGSTP
ncbi:MAG: MMPL family transporter [Planctomycetes bacterium]|nr:MMPL family transporter [Planctomycetota bacterium]